VHAVDGSGAGVTEFVAVINQQTQRHGHVVDLDGPQTLEA
jgi:hypothetical protein